METDNDNFSVDRSEIDIFSPEERNEITTRIEAASAREAVAPPGLPSKKDAAKRGFFPLLVNAGAFILLAAGLFLLFSFQQTDAAEIRESGAVLGVTERALIREIRNEAHSRLNEKEAAIESMNQRIAGIDAELRRFNPPETLTDDERSVMEGLRRQQEEYRENLVQLQQDKAQILTETRIRETRQRETTLHARMEEQQRTPESLSEIQTAREELSKISGEAEKTIFIERQISGFYSNIYRQIQAGRYAEAEDSIAALNEFLATPSFVSIKAIQARYESDAAAISALSVLITEAQKTGGTPPAQIAALSDRNSVSVDPQREIPPLVPAAAGAETILRQQLAEQNAALAELQRNMADLQERNAADQQVIAEQVRQLENLRAQNTSYAQTIDSLQRTISTINTALQNRQ